MPEQAPLFLFIAYAPSDADYCADLRSHLAVLERTEKMRIGDCQVMAGKEREAELIAQAQAADIILLLLSADFIQSDFCYDTLLPLVLARHQNYDAVAIPIVIRQCFWHDTPLQDLGILPKNGIPPNNADVWSSPDDAYAQIVSEIHQIVRETAHTKGLNGDTDAPYPQPAPASPYRQGKVLYLIPPQMTLDKAHTCYIRIAPEEVSEAALRDKLQEASNAVIEQVRIDSIMKTELIDDSGEDAFEIHLTGELEQPIEDYCYTEWRYRVTPRKKGKFALCIKISVLVLTKIGNKEKEIYKNIVVLEREIAVSTQTAADATWQLAPNSIAVDAAQQGGLGRIEVLIDDINKNETSIDKPSDVVIHQIKTDPITDPNAQTDERPIRPTNSPFRALRRILPLVVVGIFAVVLFKIAYMPMSTTHHQGSTDTTKIPTINLSDSTCIERDSLPLYAPIYPQQDTLPTPKDGNNL